MNCRKQKKVIRSVSRHVEGVRGPSADHGFNQPYFRTRQRSRIRNRSVFEHFLRSSNRKLWSLQVVAALHERRHQMKRTVRLLLAGILLLGTFSTVTLADGGSPPPVCSPWFCK